MSRKVVMWVIKSLVGLVVIGSGVAKLLGAQMMVDTLTRFGLGDKIWLIAIGELLAVILFLIPRTSSLGVLVMSGHMGGVIATHMQHGESFILPSILLLLVWIAGVLGNPAMLGNLIKSDSP